MADSPSHKFGQVIGDFLESVICPLLENFCSKQNLYLDYQKKDRPARKGKKVTWKDNDGNSHDLDFVIEKNGSDDHVGDPIAFIEVAWRRYTKHSKNKAQEIQGAIIPLSQTHKKNNPFLGAILAGNFTGNSIEQLHSLGFSTMYFPYQTMIATFKTVGIDIAFEEDTPDAMYTIATKSIMDATPEMVKVIHKNFLNSNDAQIRNFIIALEKRLSRILARITIIPLYGNSSEFISISEAIDFVSTYGLIQKVDNFCKFEVHVEFSNGDKLEGFFETKDTLLSFLEYVEKQ